MCFLVFSTLYFDNLLKKKNPNRNSLEIIYRTNEFVGLLDSSTLQSH